MQKKFSSTLWVARSVISALFMLHAAWAQDGSSSAAPAAAQALPVNSSAPSVQSNDVFVDQAPERHIVVRGDTLWGIAEKYLKNPLQWSQVWNMNRDQVRNPHWIYPGQVIVLDKIAGQMHLATPLSGSSAGTVRLKPAVRSSIESEAIPSIPTAAIEPFLSRSIVVDSAAMSEAPYVIGSKERVLLGRGDVIYASGINDPNVTDYDIFRPGNVLRDPDSENSSATPSSDNSFLGNSDSERVLGYEAVFLGSAKVLRRGTLTTLVISSSKQEISAGDRLIPAIKPPFINYTPHRPDSSIEGRIVSVYGGVAQGGKGQIVVLNRGARHGVEIGHILALQEVGQIVHDRVNPKPQTLVQMPDERNGLVFVFRVFDKVAYALILQSIGPVSVGDRFQRP